MIKYFISTGCSFTEVPMPEAQNRTYVETNDFPHYTFAWPVHVNNFLKTLPCYKGKGASGNSIISKTTIFEVLNALKTYKPEEILVGIMWSGAYRHEIYSTNISLNYHEVDVGILNSNNPTNVGGNPSYYKVMPYWKDELSTLYYKHIHDDVGSYIQTIENILRVQWLLKNYNIKYFMTQYYNLTFPKDDLKKHPDIEYLYNEIDFDNWLEVDSEWHWCARYQDPNTWDSLDVGHFKHPNNFLHKSFAEQVIIPHLQKKGYV